MYTPENILSLNPNEVFVFGSNLEGLHGGGAARHAYKHFGAEWGVGVGSTGQCYAIPTMKGGVSSIAIYIDEFVEYAKSHPTKLFFVTKIGCGIAGYSISDIAPLFKEAYGVTNIVLPLEFVEILGSL